MPVCLTIEGEGPEVEIDAFTFPVIEYEGEPTTVLMVWIDLGQANRFGLYQRLAKRYQSGEEKRYSVLVESKKNGKNGIKDIGAAYLMDVARIIRAQITSSPGGPKGNLTFKSSSIGSIPPELLRGS